ncbi:uncharacterized protein LOC143290154 isoform X2 [Babylonia areolata]|uniref:uncharacterized protein LOC143290154 isoform X2 n=1 Tax=Babylonia areolata TaxID=304850 RepID=UPI003FD13895
MEAIREAESVRFTEDVCVQYNPSSSSRVTDNNIAMNDDGHVSDNEIMDTLPFDDNDSVYRRRISHLFVKAWRERIGEYCVRVSCTAIVFWWSCPVSTLPSYLLVSALSPALFYVTCRTRYRQHGKTPDAQRILGRWRFSAVPYTVDTERSWQAGLAGVLSFFLLCWLIYGTIVIVLTSRRIDETADNCSLAVAVGPSPANSTTPHTALLVRNTSSLSSAIGTGGQSGKNDSVQMKESSFSLLPSSSSSSLSMLSSSSFMFFTLRPSKKNSTTADQYTSPYNYSAMTPSSASHYTDSTDVREGTGADSDIKLASHGREECAGCDEGFLTWCFSLVLFDWLYLATMVVNLLVVGTVPCCCYVSLDV